MKFSYWIMGMILTTGFSCRKENKPCLADIIQPGVNVTVREQSSQKNLAVYYDSIEIKNYAGNIQFSYVNQTDSSLFITMDDLVHPVLYFRIKPSTYIDTLFVHLHQVPWNDGSCSGTQLITDSVFCNGLKLNNTNTFNYTL